MVDFLYTDWYNKGRDIRNAKYKGGDWNGQQGRNLKCGAGFIHARGYYAVGVQEIVDRAGVTKPTLYYYFGSKLGLLKSLLESGYKILEDGVLEAAGTNAGLPEVLYRVARVFFDFAATHEKFYLFMLALFYSGRENEAFQTVSPFIERYYRIIVGIFEKAAPQLAT